MKIARLGPGWFAAFGTGVEMGHFAFVKFEYFEI